jgi:hypothetical protein
MANESTYALVSGLINPIWEGALWYAMHNFAMPQLVTNFTDMRGMADRKVSEYKETGVTDNLAETDDLDNARYEFDRDLLSTISPKEAGKQFLITDRRVETDPESVMVDAARDIGYAIGKKTEQDLLALFPSLTGGQFGDDTNAMSLDLVFAGRARLEAAAIPGPYVVVLHPYQWLDIFSALTSLTNAAPLTIRENASQNYFVSRVADLTFVVPSLVPTTAVDNEIQTGTITGTPTGGTFKLKFAGAETASIAYNATGATVQTALRALATMGTNGVSVTGGAGGPYVVTFDGASVAGQDVPMITLSVNAMTGGTAPTIAFVETNKGSNYATGAIYERSALAYDLRRALRIEPQRDASKRATELNASIIYAAATWRPTRGVQLRSDASSPF